ncbi:complement decay-accelerating factor isoform X2 [Melanotaenia boesemani]|uniref:complement decay-accelerating factor isoform X2 n=1 Tax=Melanotaenia boesemani TaxID=1250792 RepID=UPI001C049480|nr:complement decay-accelerating factor isoform X2 [Melanotaenia boesemani]
MEFLLDTRGLRKLKSLLIIYLFVVNTAGDCPKPAGHGPMILSNEALLRNDFPDGCEVTLLCTAGYFKESGSGIITCIDQEWTKPDLICKKKDCGPPKPEPNMQFDTSAGTLFGDIIQVTCDKGYKIRGMSYRQCFDGGWFGRGTCNIVKCGKPPEVTNGRSLWDLPDNPKYGDTVKYSCDVGYTLIGDPSIKCNENGQYSSQPPECKEHRITTEMTTFFTTAAKEASTSAVISTTPTAPHRDNTITVTASATVSPSEQGGKIILTPQGKAATTSATTSTLSSFEDKGKAVIDTNKDFGYKAVAISATVTALVACIGAFFLNKLLRRKGSYDTGEDLKPELLQFQNL